EREADDDERAGPRGRLGVARRARGERAREGGAVREALLGVARERSRDDRFEPGRRSERLGAALGDLREDLDERLTGEGGTPREALVEDRSEREDVGRRADVLRILG